MTIRKLFTILIFCFGSLALSGCGVVSSAVDNVSGLVGLNETGTVIANRAQIRSSYAVVAADLLEVKRGDTLEVMDEIDFEKVHWYRVRANDEDKTEGWIEAQNVITSDFWTNRKKSPKRTKIINRRQPDKFAPRPICEQLPNRATTIFSSNSTIFRRLK